MGVKVLKIGGKDKEYKEKLHRYLINTEPIRIITTSIMSRKGRTLIETYSDDDYLDIFCLVRDIDKDKVINILQRHSEAMMNEIDDLKEGEYNNEIFN